MKTLMTYLSVCLFPGANHEASHPFFFFFLWWEQKKYLCDLIWYIIFSEILCIKIVLTEKWIFKTKQNKNTIHISCVLELIISIHTNRPLYLSVDSTVFSFLFLFFPSTFVACGSKVYGFLSFLEPRSKVATQSSFEGLQIIKKQSRQNI